MGKDSFNRIEGKKKTSEPVVDVNTLSRIASGVEITGDIVSSGDIRIDGKVNGSVRSQGRIVIGESAVVTGKIFCSVLDLWGTVDGEMSVYDTLSLKASSSVKGIVRVRKFQVEIGARVNGSFEMLSDEASAQAEQVI